MINCHLCGKTVILLTSHLQKTHKWTIKETKDFQKSALHEFKKIAKSNSGKHSTADMSNEMSTTSCHPKSSFAFDESSYAMIEPARKLSWAEMDALDYRQCGTYPVEFSNENASKVHNLIEAYLQGAQNYLEKTYLDLHQALTGILCDARSSDRDIVDGNMDVSIYLQSVLKPSLGYLREGSALEMRRLVNLLNNGGYLRQ